MRDRTCQLDLSSLHRVQGTVTRGPVISSPGPEGSLISFLTSGKAPVKSLPGDEKTGHDDMVAAEACFPSYVMPLSQSGCKKKVIGRWLSEGRVESFGILSRCSFQASAPRNIPTRAFRFRRHKD